MNRLRTLGRMLGRRQERHAGRGLGLAIGLQESGMRHRLESAANDRLGHRRSAIEHEAERGRVGRLHRGVMDDHVDHRRHEQRRRDAKPRHRFQKGARFESRHEDVLAAHRGHEEGRGAVRQMEHRSGVEVDDIRAEPERRRAQHRVGGDVAMAQHHALRTSGRSPGVEDAGEIIAPLAGVGDGSASGDQVFVGEQSLGREAVADADDVAQPRADFAQHRQEGVVDEQRRTAGILEPERNLRWR